MIKILVVDDEKPISDIIKYNLEKEGYEVFTCYNGEEAVRVANQLRPDLILLDLMLPKLNGFEVCKKVREFSNCPIIMLTAKEEESDKVAGLEQGADDYVTKPFGHKELLARVKAHARRYQSMVGTDSSVDGNSGHCRLEIIPETYDVRRDGEEIELTQREFDLLTFLINNSGKVFSREQLLELVWGFDYFGDVRTVDVTIHRLREKIEKNPSKAEFILTKRGFGYYFRRH